MKCNIYNPFVKLSIFISGVPNVHNCTHTHIFNSTGSNYIKLQAVDIGSKLVKYMIGVKIV